MPYFSKAIYRSPELQPGECERGVQSNRPLEILTRGLVRGIPLPAVRQEALLVLPVRLQIPGRDPGKWCELGGRDAVAENQEGQSRRHRIHEGEHVRTDDLCSSGDGTVGEIDKLNAQLKVIARFGERAEDQRVRA